MRKLKLTDLLILVGAIVLDQLTKLLVSTTMNLYDRKDFIPGFLNFLYTVNTGAAWSMFSGKQIALIVVASCVCIGLLIYLIIKETPFLERLGWLFVISGALGNIIDRVRFNYVIDFIETAFIEFPVFNIADCFVCVGVGLVLLSVFTSKEK